MGGEGRAGVNLVGLAWLPGGAVAGSCSASEQCGCMQRSPWAVVCKRALLDAAGTGNQVAQRDVRHVHGSRLLSQQYNIHVYT